VSERLGHSNIAIALENKAKELEKYKNDTSNRVKEFVTSTIKNLKEDAVKERQHADETKQLRRIEYEG